MDYLSYLRKAVEKRRDLFESPGTTAFRLVNSDGDDIDGLTVDIYGEYLLAQYYDESLLPVITSLGEALRQLTTILPVPVRGIALKNRCRRSMAAKDPSSSYRSVLIHGQMPPKHYVVTQNGIRVKVDLIDGQNTGLFLDMRELREKLSGHYGTIDTLLNLFSYTAVFSVHARINGVKNAVNVDLSKAVLRRARANYLINELAADDRDFICDDALKWVRRSVKIGRCYSMVIFDPPTFSRNRKRTFSVQRDYPDICRQLSVLAAGGHVLTSINALEVTEREYRSFHPGNWELEFLSHESGDFPFRQRPYLKAGLWRVKSGK